MLQQNRKPCAVFAHITCCLLSGGFIGQPAARRNVKVKEFGVNTEPQYRKKAKKQ